MAEPKYIVATDREHFYTRSQPAKLYKLEGYMNRAVLAASGTAEQMQELADELNGTADRAERAEAERDKLAAKLDAVKAVRAKYRTWHSMSNDDESKLDAILADTETREEGDL